MGGAATYESVVRFRPVVVVAAAAVLSCVLTSCGASVGGSASASTLADFRNGFVEFQYPTDWTAAEPDTTQQLHFHPMVYLSPQPTGDPCHVDGTVTACGWPVKRVRPGGVLVVWENRGYPGWSLASMPGTPIRVGGRPARRLVSTPGSCGSIGADETVEVSIARPLSGNYTAVTACLRKPDVAARETELAAVLASAHFKTP
jgi:hypothetical protein